MKSQFFQNCIYKSSEGQIFTSGRVKFSTAKFAFFQNFMLKKFWRSNLLLGERSQDIDTFCLFGGWGSSKQRKVEVNYMKLTYLCKKDIY